MEILQTVYTLFKAIAGEKSSIDPDILYAIDLFFMNDPDAYINQEFEYAGLEEEEADIDALYQHVLQSLNEDGGSYLANLVCSMDRSAALDSDTRHDEIARAIVAEWME